MQERSPISYIILQQHSKLKKEKSTQKLNFSQCLITLVQMERRMKFRSPQNVSEFHSKTAAEQLSFCTHFRRGAS